MHGWRDTVKIMYKHTKLIKVWTKKCSKLILDYFFFKWEGPLQRRKIMGMMTMNLKDYIIFVCKNKEKVYLLKGILIITWPCGKFHVSEPVT